MLADRHGGIDDGVDIPDEDTGIPKEIVFLNIFLGSHVVWFLAEGVHAEDFFIAEGTGTQICLNITVSRFRTIGLHAECDYGIRLTGEQHTFFHNTLELSLVHDDMVTGRHHNVGLRISRLDAPTDIGNAWSGVSATWLTEDVAFRHVGQLFFDDGCIFLIGDNPDILGTYQITKPLYGQLQ